MIDQITIIHPSRSRADRCLETARKWMGSTSEGAKVVYILSVDSDDPQLPIYQNICNFPTGSPNKIFGIVIGNNRNVIQAANNGVKFAPQEGINDLIILVSDDFECFPNWDLFLMGNLSDKEDFIVKTSDGIQDWIITLPIMDRKYFNRFGYIYYPEYHHMFCDTEMTAVADLTGRKIDLRSNEFVFRHIHYTTGLSHRDIINEKNDATWAQGEELYNRRKAANFYL